jgi:2-polyprenyl-3-methyl-5-hydroxy-6-metoxy-1,4-benzoquinol methylase
MTVDPETGTMTADVQERTRSRNRELRSGTEDRDSQFHCLMCQGTRHRTVFREFDVDILQCCTCQHVFSSFSADPHFDGFWGEEVADNGQAYWSQARNPMYRDFIKRFLRQRSGRLLDMGCGLGYFVKAVAGVANWEAYGCEISPAALRYARAKLGLENIVCSRLEDAALPQESFDLITMWDVIDHIPHPDPLLRRCHALLRAGGACFIRTPNVHVQLARARIKRLIKGMRPDVSYLQARAHMHHYSMSTIRRLLERNGFTNVEFMHLTPVEGLNATTAQKALKFVGFQSVRALAALSRGHLNFDNLFVIGRKPS